jgi:glycosyltransferase involved in cell wall biosynthesis
MRIVDVSTFTGYPPANGSSMRIFHLLRALSRRHDVRHFSQPGYSEIRQPGFAAEVEVSPTHLEHRYVHPLSAAAGEWCRRRWVYQFVVAGAVLRLTRPSLLRDWVRWAEVVLVEHPWQFSAVARLRPRAPLVLASHNAEVSTRASFAVAAGARATNSNWLRTVERLERAAVARADLILVVSQRDRQAYVDRYAVGEARLTVIPNGSDTELFAPVGADRRRQLRQHLGLPARPTAVFIAAGPKPPDRAALDWVRRIARAVPELNFLVVGGVLSTPESDGNFIATGRVERPWLYLQAADLSLCPVEYGGGTKIKLWDSLAAGLPTVVFAEAIEGTALADGEHVLVAEKSESAVVDAVRRIVRDQALERGLASRGRTFVVAHHDWRAIADGLERKLVELAESRRAARTRECQRTLTGS